MRDTIYVIYDDLGNCYCYFYGGILSFYLAKFHLRRLNKKFKNSGTKFIMVMECLSYSLTIAHRKSFGFFDD